MRALPSLILCLFLAARGTALPAQQPTTNGPVRASGPLADTLRAFATDMVARLRALDANGVIRLYGDTTRFVHVDNGVVIPWGELSRMMRTFFATAKSNPVEVVGEPDVMLIDRNTAVVYATHRFAGTAEIPAHQGVWTGVLRRGADGWRVEHSHSSDRPPK